MTNEQMMQSAKDKAAQEYGHGDFQQALGYLIAGGNVSEFQDIEDRAMEIYASQQRELGIREGFEAARHWDDDSDYQVDVPLLKMPCTYPTVDDYLNSKK